MNTTVPSPEFPQRFNNVAAAAYLGITERQLKRLREKRLISCAYIGGRSPSYTREDLDAYVASVTVEAVVDRGN